MAGAGNLGGPDKRSLSQRKDLGPDHTGGGSPHQCGNRQDDIQRPHAHQGDQDDGEGNKGDAVCHIGDPHEDVVHGFPEVAGNQADVGTDQNDEQRGDQADEDGDPGADDRLTEDVLPHIGRPEGMFQRGREQAGLHSVFQVDRLARRIRGNGGTGDGQEDEKCQYNGRDHADPVLPEDADAAEEELDHRPERRADLIHI
ncbi:MAG: hypothetical protein ACD_87C00007G0002 [uncultured bacterium]|nr:MAG: hypothetical protein ACD_87C00007G0002 [uncultured bacterium]